MLIILLLLSEVLIYVATGSPTLEPGYKADVSSVLQDLSTIVESALLWTQQRTLDVELDFSKADASVLQQQQEQPITFRGQPLNVTHKQGYYHGNVALVKFGSKIYAAVRKIQFYFTLRTQLQDYPLDEDPAKKFISWWVSKISLCDVDSDSLQPVKCEDFNPRSWRNEECLWNAGFESLGPEDPRLIVWPGKGLYIMFISKPWPLHPGGTQPSETHCEGPWAQQPWIMPLVLYRRGVDDDDAGSSSSSNSDSSNDDSSSSGSREADSWLEPKLVRLQYHGGYLSAGHAVKMHSQHSRARHKRHVLHKEKNWNAFIYKNELYFSQSFDPHVVIKPYPNGTCIKVHESTSDVFKRLPAQPKGNTQAVLLPAALTSSSEDEYLGIVHTEINRTYMNYFYRMQAQPPFTIRSVSAPIKLVSGSHPRVPAWTKISFPLSLQLLEETQQLMIGYGSGDQKSRVRLIRLEDALKLFDTS